MKVLQINSVYNTGSTGKITHDIHTGLLNNGYNSIVCYGRGHKIVDKYIYKICSNYYSKFNNFFTRLNGLMYGCCYISTNKLIRIINKEKPDVVHIQCVNGYFVNIYKLISWLNSKDIRTVITLHAEFMFTANCGHSLECNKWKIGCGNCPRMKQVTKSIFFDKTDLSWKKMYEAFQGFKHLKIISVSPWLMNRAKESPILKKFNHQVILNGLDTNIFKPYDTTKLKESMNLSTKKIILHVTPHFSQSQSDIKGGYYILKLANMIKDDNIRIIVIGDYDKNINVPSNVIMLGKINNQELLAKYYSMADLFVLTSMKETFSMTTAESLCCGTPVFGFKAGAPELIAIKKYSSFVEFGDITKLYDEITKNIIKKKDSNISRIAREKYSKEQMLSKYLKLYESFYKDE